MLALRFADIDFGRGPIVLRGETTKSKRTRLAPISTQRLRAILKAHGIKPRWTARLKFKGLSRSRRTRSADRPAWHDLRHEYASRLVERGVPLAQVRDLLGHASITTTERYDNQKLENLQIAAAKLESELTFDPPPLAPDAAPRARKASTFRLKPEATTARTKFQESFKIAGQQEASAPLDGVPAIEPSSTFAKATADKNPDNVVQSVFRSETAL